MSLVDRVIDAHGGLDRWRRAGAVTLRLSSGGLAFASKGCRTALHDLTAAVATTGQRVELSTPAWTYRFDGDIPKPAAGGWSDRDIAAFAAAALWTYVSLPFILPELEVEEQGDRLVIRFAPRMRTHSPVQVLHVDDEGLIRRHDYTALAFGRCARATQEVGGYREVDGLRLPTRRRVRPRFWPHRPLLVWIDIHAAAVEDPPSLGRLHPPNTVGASRRRSPPTPRRVERYC